MPILTQHALIRAQQRGIDEQAIALALTYGDHRRSFDGRETFTLIDRVLASLPFAVDVAKLRGIQVIASNNAIITVLHKHSVSRRPGIGRKAHLLRQIREREERRILRKFR